MLLQAAKDYEEMRAELTKYEGLANMFECPDKVQPAIAGIAELKADLIMVKDVWDTSALVEVQFQVSQVQLSGHVQSSTVRLSHRYISKLHELGG